MMRVRNRAVTIRRVVMSSLQCAFDCSEFASLTDRSLCYRAPPSFARPRNSKEKRMNHRWLVCAAAIVLIALPFAAAKAPTVKPAATSSEIPAAVRHGIDAFSGDALRAHVRFLASDLLEGRGPGTRGDDLAMNYIAAQFEAAGLKPDGDHGTYFQKVPLIGIAMDPANTTLSLSKEGAPAIGPLKHLEQFVGDDE